MIGEGKIGIDESAVEEVARKEYRKEECGMEGELFRKDGIQMRPDIGRAGIRGKIVKFGSCLEGIDPTEHIKEKLPGFFWCEAKRMKENFVFAHMRPEEDGVFFIGDDIDEPVLSQETQPE
jgi:hypothetical protein